MNLCCTGSPCDSTNDLILTPTAESCHCFQIGGYCTPDKHLFRFSQLRVHAKQWLFQPPRLKAAVRKTESSLMEKGIGINILLKVRIMHHIEHSMRVSNNRNPSITNELSFTVPAHCLNRHNDVQIIDLPKLGCLDLSSS